jgi:hypothetical protein
MPSEEAELKMILMTKGIAAAAAAAAAVDA